MTLSRAALSALAAGLLCAGCVVVPVTRESYDADCAVVTHHMELTTMELTQMYRCSAGGMRIQPVCGAEVIAAVGVTAVSAVVSGSIVVFGNVAYWAERQTGCLVRPAASTPA